MILRMAAPFRRLPPARPKPSRAHNKGADAILRLSAPVAYVVLCASCLLDSRQRAPPTAGTERTAEETTALRRIELATHPCRHDSTFPWCPLASPRVCCDARQ